MGSGHNRLIICDACSPSPEWQCTKTCTTTHNCPPHMHHHHHHHPWNPQKIDQRTNSVILNPGVKTNSWTPVCNFFFSSRMPCSIKQTSWAASVLEVVAEGLIPSGLLRGGSPWLGQCRGSNQYQDKSCLSMDNCRRKLHPFPPHPLRLPSQSLHKHGGTTCLLKTWWWCPSEQ